MKENLIVGHWYKVTDGLLSRVIKNNIWYIKYLKDDKGFIESSEHIHNLDYHNHIGNFGKIEDYTFTPINLSEIFDYLPDNHPDKVKIKKTIDKSHNKILIKLLKNV